MTGSYLPCWQLACHRFNCRGLLRLGSCRRHGDILARCHRLLLRHPWLKVLDWLRGPSHGDLPRCRLLGGWLRLVLLRWLDHRVRLRLSRWAAGHLVTSEGVSRCGGGGRGITCHRLFRWNRDRLGIGLAGHVLGHAGGDGSRS